ncbi:MAG TPA: hypothetical protein VM577_08440 [Anaerovoracaceae bacterium]|nr:hypothetical protein [Anaerovoracaceae bacterium]
MNFTKHVDAIRDRKFFYANWLGLKVPARLTKAEVAELSDEDKAGYELQLKRFEARNRRKSEAAKAGRPERPRTARRVMQRAILKAQRNLEKAELRAKKAAEEAERVKQEATQ